MTEQLTGRFAQQGENYPFGSDLVKLEVRLGSNRIDEEFDLNATVTFGEVEREVDRETIIGLSTNVYRIRIKYCKLMYTSIGCHIPERTKYRLPIQTGVFSRKSKTQVSNETHRFLTGTATAKAEITNNSSGSLGLGGAAESRLNRKVEGNTETEIVSDVNLIEPIPNGWAIGVDGIGDPLRENINGCLRSCYFDKEVEKYPRTCVVRFDDERTKAILNFWLSARGGLYVERLNDGTAEFAELKGKARAKAIEEMRSRIAGIVIEKKLKDELIIARSSYLIEKDMQL